MSERKMIYLCLAHMTETGEEQKYVKEAFDTNWVVPLGPNVNGFEKDLEAFVGEGKRVVALNSGTAAVHLALINCGVQPGDEVCVQSFTFCASSHPITYLGAKPVFIGSEKGTWNMDPELLERAIIDRKEKTGKYPKAIVPVALYGMPYDCDKIMAIADKYGIPVVEDAAEGFGSRYKGQVLGTFGKYGVLSFNGNKMITTSGGGALICNGSLSPRPLLQRGSQCAGRLQTADPMLYELLKANAEVNRNNPTDAEKALWEMLRGSNLGYKFRRQHPIADFVVDFYCVEKGLTIELDGGYHKDPKQAEADKLRTSILEELGFTEVRFSNEEVLNNTDSVLHIIKTLCKSLPSKRWAPEAPSLEERAGGEAPDAQWNTIMMYATQYRESYPYYQHEKIGYNYRMSNICAGIGRGQMTIVDEHIAHHKHVQALYKELLKDVPGVTLHEQPTATYKKSLPSGGDLEEALYDSNYWLCTITLDPSVKVKGQENAYKEVIKTAVGGAAGVIHAADSATTDCQPNENVEAMRVFMLDKKVEARPVWKPMHKQPVYQGCPAYTNEVETDLFKIGMCIPAGPYVKDDDVRYIVDCIKEAIKG